MSYDVSLTTSAGGDEYAELTWRNMTSNVARMWRHAGADLAEFHGKQASAMQLMLRTAVAAMEADPDTYRAMNPANGWGNYETCLGFLRGLVEDFTAYPDATVVVSR